MVGQSLEINCGDWPHQEQGMLTKLADLITRMEEGAENKENGGSVPGKHLGGLALPLTKVPTVRERT